MPTSQGILSSEITQHKNLIPILICLALVLLTIIAFWPLKDCGFINVDDDAYVYKNDYVQQGLSWKSIQWAFSADSSSVAGHWHPITWLSLMLDYEFFGLNPYGYHLTNLFFHILNAILLFLIFHRMTKAIWQSAFVAALFAIHPLHVESVAWVTERKDVLSTFFWMLTMGTYVFYVERKTFSRYFIILVFFMVGLMSKAMLVTLPFVLVLLDYWPLNRFQATQPSSDRLGKWHRVRGLVWEKIPIFILSGVFSFIPILAVKNAHTMNTSLSFIGRFRNAFLSYVIYLWKMIWPSNLAIFYPYPAEIEKWQILGAVLILIGISAFVLWMRKRFPFLLVGWLWYLGTLLPVIGIIQAGSQAYADRYTYIPLIGLFIIVAFTIPILINNLSYRRMIINIVAVILLMGLITATWIQVTHWKNSKVLMEHALAVTSNNYIAHDGLGGDLLIKGQKLQAEQHFNEALRIKPNDTIALYALASLYEAEGKKSEAMMLYKKAFQSDPWLAAAYYKLAIFYYRQGNFQEAINCLMEALRIDPGQATVYNTLGNIMDTIGKTDEAIKYYNKALNIKPDFVETHINLGELFFMHDKMEEAKEHFKKAIQIKPNSIEAHFNLAILLLAQRKSEEAVQEFREVIRIDPNNVNANYYLRVITAAQ
jgi:tetratricopeptide (TPR) repeat protein